MKRSTIFDDAIAELERILDVFRGQDRELDVVLTTLGGLRELRDAQLIADADALGATPHGPSPKLVQPKEEPNE
jgi:hypothetical protein